MITCNKNNFGADPVIFNDYQTADFCILNGKFKYDPANAAYLAAERLEINLPDSFLMTTSAISTAVIISTGTQKQLGTVLRCWIEYRVLCIEKLTHWDNDGELTIVIASAFVTRGYRGEYVPNERAVISVNGNAAFERSFFVVKDDWVYLGGYFEKFPHSNYNPGYNCIEFTGFPEDVEVEIPVALKMSSYNSKEKGSCVGIGRIYGGKLYLEIPFSYNDCGGKGTFINFFAIRHNYTPVLPTVEDINLTYEDVAPGRDTNVNSFDFTMSSAPALCSINTDIEATGYLVHHKIVINNYPKAAPDFMSFFCLGRTSQEEGYKVFMKLVDFSKASSGISFTHLSYSIFADGEVFGTSFMAKALLGEVSAY